jgi:hypothetical protein
MAQRKYLTLLSLSLAALTLSGCSSLGFFNAPEKEVVVQTEYVEKKIPLQAKPKPMTLNDVNWYVVTEENFDEFLEKYKKENGNEWVFYAISVRSYESMALNMAEIQRYLESQNAIIVYYENAINPPIEKGDGSDNQDPSPSN